MRATRSRFATTEGSRKRGRCLGAIAAYTIPSSRAREGAPALAAGCTGAQGRARHPVGNPCARKLAAEATDIPPGVLNVLTSTDAAVGAELTTHATSTSCRSRARRPSAPDHGAASATVSACSSSRRQVRVRAPRRRRRALAALSARRDDLALGAGVCDHLAPRRAPRALRRGRSSPRPHDHRTRGRTATHLTLENDGAAINARQREKVAVSQSRDRRRAEALTGGRIPNTSPAVFLRADVARERHENRRSPRTSCSDRCSSASPRRLRRRGSHRETRSSALRRGRRRHRERALGVPDDPGRHDERQRRVYYGPDAPLAATSNRDRREMGAAGSTSPRGKTLAEPAT